MKKIIFLCTGNSCRSQMAEGFARNMLSNEKNFINSAGIQAEGINYLAITVMKELDVDISTQESKTISSINLRQFDLIVTVCDRAKSTCPTILRKKVIHKNIIDPALATGEMSKQLTIYKNVRDQIQIFIENLVNNYHNICQERN